MGRKVKKIEKTFNKASAGLVSYLSNTCPKSYFAQNEQMIHDLIKKKPEEPIAYFTKFVYRDDEYREKLLDGDEDFFMEHSWDDIPNMEEQIIKKIFDFKELWVELNKEDKNTIKGIMKGFIVLCEKYIFALDDEMQKNKFRKQKIVEAEEEDSDYDIDSISIGSTDKKKKHSHHHSRKKNS